MSIDERFSADSQAAVQSARQCGGRLCVNDYGAGRAPTVTLAFISVCAAQEFNRLLIRAMRTAEEVEAMDLQQASAGFGPAVVEAA
jgi:hypothetical protein